MSAVLEEYNKMKIKFNLPEMEKLKTVFHFDDDIDCIEDMCSEMTNKTFEFVEQVIEPLIWCNSHCHMIERDMMTEGETGILFDIYKKTQALKWRNNMLTLKPDKAESAKLIQEIWNFWNAFEPEVSKICKKFSDGWTDLRFTDEIAEYHG